MTPAYPPAARVAILLAACAALFCAPSLFGTELPPDDPSIAGSLAVWLRAPDAEYDPGGGLWADSSRRGNDASAVGAVGPVTYGAPSLAEHTGGSLAGVPLVGVAFSGASDDLLATPPLNGGAGLSELTLIAIYNLHGLAGDAGLTRPVGIGSLAATAQNLGNHFNLGSDPSIRKDNGSVTGHSQAVPAGVPFIRSARMDGSGVKEWFSEDGAATVALDSAGTGFTTSSDRLYLGDLRCGASPVPGFGTGTAPSDFDIIEVLVYTAALSDAQILGINEWLAAHVAGEPPPLIRSFSADPHLIASGESATLSWEVERATAVSISPAVGAVALAGGASVSPDASTTYTLTATGDGGTASAQVFLGVDIDPVPPAITEFVAANAAGLEDEDGDSSDWVEIHNPNAFALEVGGYSLTDDPNNPTKWQIPAGQSIAPGGYLVVFASGKDRGAAGAELHASFSLDQAGEFLALVAPDGSTVVSAFDPGFPDQIADVAYGIDEGGAIRFLAPPTPGAANGAGFDGRVADTKFSVDRGFYDTPQSVEITCATPGATIRYTLDGSEPSQANGSDYAGPISVATTAVLRAAAFKDGLIPSDVDTHSYLFLNDVIRQPANPPGAPATWGARAPDYAMDPRVVDDPAYRGEIIEGLASIRTLSLVVPNDEFFNNPRGIYANPQNDGRAWERAVSFEFLHPGDPGEDVQADGGIRIHGNGSRSASGQPKHSFRVEFRGEYGAKRLRYRLFPDLAIDEFDSFILRGQNAHGWTRSAQIDSNVGTTERDQSQYIRDSFARDLMKEMGNPHAGRATYVHLYINGLYWGLYNPVEYPRAYFGASHFGGEEDDFDAINRRTTTTKILDGTFEAWDAMQALANAGLASRSAYEAMAAHIDIDNLIDYMLMHQYMGSRDGPDIFNSNNMRAIRKSRGDGVVPWICMPWDMEASMFEIDVTRNVNVDDPSTLVRVYTKLRENPEFRLRYADRVRRHCFHGGALTPGRAAAIWEARAAEIYTAILGESARWGDYRRPAQPFTRDAEWEQERQRLLTTYFPTRTGFLVDLLRQNDLYPPVEAPEFSQHGGNVAAGFELGISGASGTIYYTTDGSDPREMWTGAAAGSAYAAPVPVAASAVVKARAFDNGEWSALTEATFLVGDLAAAGNLVVSELMYNPAGPSEDLEFIELRNIALEPINLGAVRFTAGIDFVFPLDSLLAPGESVLVVKNLAAFEAEYGADRRIAGVFANGTAFDNAGESVALAAADGAEIVRFRYNDKSPWPTGADGSGASLVLVDPGANPDHADPLSWRASAAAGGTPGAGDDTLPPPATPFADSDGNGRPDLIDYAISGAPQVAFDAAGSPEFWFDQTIGSDAALIIAQCSESLDVWEPAELIGRSDSAGVTSWRFRSPPGSAATFFRLVFERRATP